VSTAGSAARAEDRRLLQPSQGADEESEYDEAEAMEEDELISKKEEDEKVCGRFLHGRSRLTHFAGHCCSDQDKSGRQRKGSRRSSARRWTKQRCVTLFVLSQCRVNGCEDRRRRQAVFVSPGSGGALQTFRGYQGISFIFQSRRLQTVSQEASDPEYAALMDAQPKPKERGRKKAV
jgi:SWI/SNF-related matrix-associated actin-dependent regulator of chromatin subfamily A member 5